MAVEARQVRAARECLRVEVLASGALGLADAEVALEDVEYLAAGALDTGGAVLLSALLAGGVARLALVTVQPLKAEGAGGALVRAAALVEADAVARSVWVAAGDVAGEAVCLTRARACAALRVAGQALVGADRGWVDVGLALGARLEADHVARFGRPRHTHIERVGRGTRGTVCGAAARACRTALVAGRAR